MLGSFADFGAHTCSDVTHTGRLEAKRINLLHTHIHTLLSGNVYEGRSGKDVGFSLNDLGQEASLHLSTVMSLIIYVFLQMTHFPKGCSVLE